MTKKLFLSGLADFEEDGVLDITYERYTDYQKSVGEPLDVDPLSFPQKIEFEFATDKIISNHYITSSEPLKFRYIYDGNFKYDNNGSMTHASIDSVTVAYQDLYPGDEYEYGYFYKTATPTVIKDTSSFSQWEKAMNISMDYSAVVHEYEEQDGIITTYAGIGKDGVFRDDNLHLMPTNWYEQLFESDLLRNAEPIVPKGEVVYNEFARELIDDVLTGAQEINVNSYDAKFYNLGEGRYGVQTKGESTIDEITGVTSLQFEDQALSITNDVAATFKQVKGIDDVSGVVFRLYNAAFARLPDAKGLENWIDGNSSGGMTYALSAEEFSSSQEFKNRYGATTTDTQYITTLYSNVLGRSPDAAGLAHYEELLANGKDRGELLLDFSESPENRVLFTQVTGLS